MLYYVPKACLRSGVGPTRPRSAGELAPLVVPRHTPSTSTHRRAHVGKAAPGVDPALRLLRSAELLQKVSLIVIGN
jgi:hypothetical protein